MARMLVVEPAMNTGIRYCSILLLRLLFPRVRKYVLRILKMVEMSSSHQNCFMALQTNKGKLDSKEEMRTVVVVR